MSEYTKTDKKTILQNYLKNEINSLNEKIQDIVNCESCNYYLHQKKDVEYYEELNRILSPLYTNATTKTFGEHILQSIHNYEREIKRIKESMTAEHYTNHQVECDTLIAMRKELQEYYDSIVN